MVIQVEFTDKIEMVRTGKHQGSISKLRIDFQKLTSSDLDSKKNLPTSLEQ